LRRIVSEKFLERVDDVLGMGEYRKTLMALKFLRWELDRMVRDERNLC
jgi:hypothetical protein